MPLNAPTLPDKAKLQQALITPLTDEDTFENAWIQKQSAAAQAAARIRVIGSYVEEVDLSETTLDWFALRNVRLDSCNCANARWYAVDASRTTFSNCQIVGLHANEAQLEDVLFDTCGASFSQFRFATLKSVTFQNCDLKSADFHGSRLQKVTFQDCDLTGLQLAGGICAELDFRGSVIDGMSVTIDQLVGAKIDLQQAIVMATLLGMKVEGIGD